MRVVKAIARVGKVKLRVMKEVEGDEGEIERTK